MSKKFYGDYMNALYIVLLSAGSFFVLFVLDKLMGNRQLSQMSFFDYVVGITIGSIAAEMATDLESDWYHAIIAMTVYALIEIALTFISRKSKKARKILNGEPILLMNKGGVIGKNLKKARLTLDDLISEARIQGYFDINDIAYAIMEDSGNISFLSYQSENKEKNNSASDLSNK